MSITRRRRKRRHQRTETVKARRANSAMATVEDLASQLGIGRNQAYALVQMNVVPATRLGRRYLIPRAIISKIVSGEMLLAVPVIHA
jgi:excisionase family DNA binding protein